MFQSTGYWRGFIEGAFIYLMSSLLGVVPFTFWPGSLYMLVLLVILLLHFGAPVWTTLRMRSTKKERMSKRFLVLGPVLATLCAIVDLCITFLNVNIIAKGKPVAVNNLVTIGVQNWAVLLVFFTIAVFCTRLAQGGFLRFTMPAGPKRVTL